MLLAPAVAAEAMLLAPAVAAEIALDAAPVPAERALEAAAVASETAAEAMEVAEPTTELTKELKSIWGRASGLGFGSGVARVEGRRRDSERRARGRRVVVVARILEV
jgi:hypothetical protein